ncbi:MAG TPA: 4Fe-4S dicluster domain-containing protein [Polyangiaceae bacterium]|nr:4Fe-4S dicluster domain-containing protein [Polyangiaceae bacterium]
MTASGVDLSVDFCGVRFVNPFLLSSSPVSNSAEMVSRAFEAGWAGVAYKTVVTDRIPIIHPSPRMKSFDRGREQLVGLQNVEQTSDRGLKPNLLDMTWLKKRWPDRVVMASIMGFSDMGVPAMHAKNGGANGISAINTVRGLAGIDPDTWVPSLGVFGKGAISGISGPAVKPIGLRFIAELALEEQLGLPLSGIGGIETWVDALEYLLVGATTVQVTTGVIHYGYGIVADMIEGLSDYMAMRGIERVSELVGRALPQLHETDAFDLRRQGISAYDLARCVGCGACLTVCSDAGGQALSWDTSSRRPRLDEGKCLSCMVCSFVCPVPGLITFREMPEGWSRAPTPTLGVEV